MSTHGALIEYVKRAVATGARTIEVPAEMLHGASEEVLAEVRGYCKLCGVKIVVRE